MRRQDEGEPVDLFTTSPASPAGQNIATIFVYIVHVETI